MPHLREYPPLHAPCRPDDSVSEPVVCSIGTSVATRCQSIAVLGTSVATRCQSIAVLGTCVTTREEENRYMSNLNVSGRISCLHCM